jgi:hypothetical protein
MICNEKYLFLYPSETICIDFIHSGFKCFYFNLVFWLLLLKDEHSIALVCFL